MFDGLERGNFLAVHERERVAHVLGAAGAADAMDIIFRMLRHIVIDDVTDAGDVEPARGNIGRDHHLVFAALESFERFDPLALSAIGMEHGDGVLRGLQRMRHPISVYFRPTKNQDTVEVCPFEERDEEIELLFGGDRINGVGDSLRRRTANTDFDELGIAQHPIGEAFDFRRQRR